MRLLPALLFLPLPALAQDSDVDQGLSLMEQGARMLLDGMIADMAPALDDFTGMAEQIGPVFKDMSAEMAVAFSALMTQLDSLTYYELPEVLANGDIIIRRSPDAPPWQPPVKGTP
jgi:hypothetical protein